MGLLSSLFGSSKPDDKKQDKENKKNFDILKYDGIRARGMRQLAYAIKCFEQAAAIEEEPETLRFLAVSYTEAGRLDDARLTLDRLLIVAPDDVQALLSLARVCFMQEDYDGMADACAKATDHDEKCVAAYYLSAMAEHGLNDNVQALVMLDKTIELDENNVSALQLRAEVLCETGQPDEALADIEKILSAQPEHEDALLLKGKIYADKKDVDEAAALFDQVMELNPFNEKAYISKSELLAESGQPDKAIAVCDEAIELMPQNARLYQERGRVRLLQDDKEGSEADMAKAVELSTEGDVPAQGNPGSIGRNQVVGIY